ncbi:MAG: proline dehydrogenase family protein, partial [Planctomycetota bacterium]
MPLFSRKRNRSSSPATANANPSGRSSVADAPSPASPGSASTTRSNGKPSAASSATGDTAAIVASSPAAQEALRAALAARKSVFNPVDPAIEQEIRTIGGNLLDLARGKKSGVFSSQFWSDKLMDWAMQDEAFKIQFFRFVDTFPSLKTPDQVHDHLVDYLSQPGVTPPPGMDLGIKAGGMAKGLFTKQMTSRITGMAQKFIAGQDAASSVDQLRKLWKQNIGFTVDLLGEACISARLADEYLEKYLDLVNNLPQQVSDFPSNPRLESDYLGPIPRVNVSIKLTSLFWNVDPIAPERSIDALMERVAPILIAAKKKGVFINFDVEQFEYKEMTLDLVERACEKYDFEAGLAMQAYLRSGPDDARRVINWAKRVGRQVTVRLVKGAYWDYETINAERMGHPVPVWSRKPETDASFERMVTMFIENMPRSKDEGGVKLALGSHNARSIAHALATAKKHGLPDNAVELQMLHGMGDQLKYAVSEMGLRLREYVPVGEMVVGMAYFVRRLLENTSNESWLRAGFSDNADASVLLANPLDKVPADEPDPGITLITTAPERHQLTPAVPGLGNERPFASEPWRDFARREVRDVFAAAVESASVGGGSDRASPFNGSNGNGAASAAAASDARDSVAAAAGTREAWAATPPIVRSRVLIRAAEHLRRRRDEIAARLICVTGKTWRDADVEVCDA